ncbi:hypothetical protein CRH15_09110 [Lelliottia amnigena]|nr:hypothetical protein CRH15_09110 [Lelliottia amnigena]
MTYVFRVLEARRENPPGDIPVILELQMRWLLSRTPVTDLSKLLGICSFAACLQRELFWV